MFYLRYAMRSFWRNRRWSLFAVFSIAAGVAAIVALRSLGLAIGDSLTGNLRASNHGDITISIPGEGFGVTFGFGGNGQDDRPQLDAELLNGIDSWVRERGGEWSAWTASNAIQIASPGSTTSGRSASAQPCTTPSVMPNMLTGCAPHRGTPGTGRARRPGSGSPRWSPGRCRRTPFPTRRTVPRSALEAA